jgi:RNA recognition motif-containing protein
LIFYCTSHFKLYNVYTVIIVLHNSNFMKICTLVIINIDRDDNDDKLYSKFKKDLKLYNLLNIYITDVICV